MGEQVSWAVVVMAALGVIKDIARCYIRFVASPKARRKNGAKSGPKVEAHGSSAPERC